MRTTRQTARQPNRPRRSAPQQARAFLVPRLSPQLRQVRPSEARVFSEAPPQHQRVLVAQNYLVPLPQQLLQQRDCSGQVLSPLRRLRRFLAHLLRQLLLLQALEVLVPLPLSQRQQVSLVNQQPSRVSSAVWARLQLHLPQVCLAQHQPPQPRQQQEASSDRYVFSCHIYIPDKK